MSPRSRRKFMVDAVGTAAFLPAALASIDELRAALGAAAGDAESYWTNVRQQFSFREGRVPMNAANLCPSPKVVAQRVTELTDDIDVDCSFNNRDKFKSLLEESRDKVARHLRVSADEIALVRNTSEANNVINNGLKLKAGDEVVLWDQNHPTNNVAWDVRAARFGLTVTRVSTPRQPGDVSELVDAFKQALGEKTRVLAVTQMSNVSGLQLPIKELAELAHAREIFVHVDGAQTWGALDVNLRELGCDSFAASAHKWFMGPKEVGLLYVKQDRIEDIWPSVVAPGWGSDVAPDVRGARKFESLGQRDDAALAAVGTAADFHQTVGTKQTAARVKELAARLKAELAQLGCTLVTPRQPQLSGGVCIVDVPPNRRAEVFNRLYEEFGIAGSTSGGLRLCPHIYNTGEHIDRAVAGVRKLRGLIVG